MNIKKKSVDDSDDTNELSMGQFLWTRHGEGSGTEGIRQRIGPCLLVSREMGAGGSLIAMRAAERLGWEILDKEIVEALASEYGTSRVVLDAVDEKSVGWLTDLFNGWIDGHGFSQLSYVHRLSQLVGAAAKRGNVVIVGRGARFILPRQAGFSVRIIAPFDFRVEQVVLRKGISATIARKLVERSDSDRQAFIEKYFHHNVANPHCHDLIVNVEQLVQEDAVNLIVDSVHSWLNRSGFKDRQFTNR